MDPTHHQKGSKRSKKRARSKSFNSDSEATGGPLIACITNASTERSIVKAVFVNTWDGMLEMLATLMKKDTNGHRSEPLIGFDMEWASAFGKGIPSVGNLTRISHFIFSNRDVAYVYSPDHSLLLRDSFISFLRHADFSFVGMGMNENMAKLAVEYNVSCRNTLDLGSKAAELKKNPRLHGCGIDLLAKEFGFSETPRPSVVREKGFNKPYGILNGDHVIEAIANTCAYQ